MNKKKSATPRKKRVEKELHDRAWDEAWAAVRNAQSITASVSDELKRVQQNSIRTYRMLEAERLELWTRARKLLVLMKSLEVRTEDDGSPQRTSIDRWK